MLHVQSYHTYMNDVLFKRYPHFNPSLVHIPNGNAEEFRWRNKALWIFNKPTRSVDIQILGIGENGHIGFNEPGTDVNSATHVVNLTESTINANSRYFEDGDESAKSGNFYGTFYNFKAQRIILLAFERRKSGYWEISWKWSE